MFFRHPSKMPEVLDFLLVRMREKHRTESNIVFETMSFSATKRRIAGAGEGRQVGTRPSPVGGHVTTSTGTHSLDALLAGHAGLVLGTSLLIEESGTTDFGGALLRYYAAEGVVQGHNVHVLGMSETPWGRELPGLSSGETKSTEDRKGSEDKMKIAWRYERLGEFGAGARGGHSFIVIESFLTDLFIRQKYITDNRIILKYSSNLLS